MSTTLERTDRTTTPRPTGEPEGPVGRSTRTWRLWALLAIPFALLAIAIAVGFGIGGDEGDPVASAEADTYVLDGTRALPGQPDGWFIAPEGLGSQVLGNVLEQSSPVEQGYRIGFPDGSFDPAASATDTAAPQYPIDRIR